MPLWRLLVALHDAETEVGITSESAELLRQAVDAKLRQLRRPVNSRQEGNASCAD